MRILALLIALLLATASPVPSAHADMTGDCVGADCAPASTDRHTLPCCPQGCTATGALQAVCIETGALPPLPAAGRPVPENPSRPASLMWPPPHRPPAS